MATLIIALIFASALPNLCHAQVLYGSMVGNVKDETGGAIPGADVTIINNDTNLTRHGVTNEVGLYNFPTVPSGTYTLRVSMPGFRDYVKANIVVTVNSTTRADAVLSVGEVTDEVVVTSEATELLQTDRAEVHHEVTRKQIENLPVPVGRNYQNLFETIPGFEMVGSSRAGRMGGCNPSQSRHFNVNGTTRSTTSTNIDGAPTAHIWNVGASATVPALEAIETVNVTTNSFDAEQGLAGGAVINVQIKSGTNDFHGSLFEYHSNHRLRARNFFLPPDEDKSKYIHNQWGATLGGPIKRDKLFFFASYEGRSERENGTRILSVPTAAVRQGDFSAFDTIIYDPLTGNPDGTGRTPFPGNRVPADRIDPIVQKIIDRIPFPNLPGMEASESNNFFASKPFSSDRWTIDSKIDWVVTDNFNLFGSYSIFDFGAEHLTAYGEQLDGPRVGGGNAGDAWGNNTKISIGANYIVTPTFLIDGNFGFVRQSTNVEQPGIGENIGLDLLGIPGTNGPERFQSGWPRFDVSGYSHYGTEEPWTPYYRDDDQFAYRANFTWTRRSHEIRWGMDINAEQMNHTQPEFQGGASMGARGRFTFGPGPTQLCEVAGPSGCERLSPSVNQVNSFATFLLGLPTQFGKNLLTLFPYTTRTWRYSVYIRDRWQVTPRLTLSYGTRWEYFPMPTRADRGFERYDPETNMMLIGGVGDIPRDLGVRMSKKLFAPRLGLAYRINDETVFRAGYGISIDPYSLARPLRTNHPILIELVVPSEHSLVPAGQLAGGIPPITPPDLGNGIIEVPENVSTQTVPLDFQRGYIQSWNVTLQRELKWGFVGEAGYVATRQVRQLGYHQLNWSPVGGGNAGRQLFARFGRTANTRMVAPVGGSNYHSLQAQLQRRFADGYSLGVAYTLSKSISDSGLDASDASLAINIPEYYHLNRSVSGFDRRHRLFITNILELPFGRGKRWLADQGFLTQLLSGWQVNSIVGILSGRPFSVTASGTSLNAPFSTQRADQVKEKVEILGGVGPGQPYFDPTAFAPVDEPRFGTAGFNILRGPGQFNWDFGLFRQFRLSEEVNLEFRAEAFNFTNTPKFGNPGANVSNVRYAPDGSIDDLNGFGEITSATEEREFRFGLRIAF